jgi:hypothetical protein
MIDLAPPIISAILIGLGATLTFDMWGQLLKLAFNITPSNICLVGRWLCYMPEGTFKHSTIASTPHKRGECTVGWFAHYLIGITFAIVFVALIGDTWLQHPTPIPALVFGVVTVLAPFAILQPAFGLGFAASKTPHPAQARVRSLLNHAAFGAGLYLFAMVAHWLLGIL